MKKVANRKELSKHYILYSYFCGHLLFIWIDIVFSSLRYTQNSNYSVRSFIDLAIYNDHVFTL